MPDVRIVHFWRMESLIGPLLIAATQRGLCNLQFRGEMPKQRKNEVWIESREELRPYQEEIEAYFRGQLHDFTFPLDLQGTEFQKNCWEALCRIPYGETCSYAEIAKSVGRPTAYRAVGQANHNNPIAIVVPCHRVVGANGTLTGYGGGLNVKEKLLRLEGVALQGQLGLADASPDQQEKKSA